MMNNFRLNFEVRDNEVDIQGIVNNANYAIYFAHARHKFLKESKIDFAEMAKSNQLLVLISTNIEFKKPLIPGTEFYVTCILEPEGKLKFAFHQEIRSMDGETLFAKSKNIGVCIDGNNRNRPYVPKNLEKILKS